MDSHSGAGAAFGLAFFFLTGAVGLAFLGIVVYFLVTLHRIASSLELVVQAIVEDRRRETTSTEVAPAVVSSEAGGAAPLEARDRPDDTASAPETPLQGRDDA